MIISHFNWILNFSFRFVPDKGFEGADKSGRGDGPVAFEQHHQDTNFDPFQIDDFLGNLKTGSGGGGGAGDKNNTSSSSNSNKRHQQEEESSHSKKSSSSSKDKDYESSKKKRK